jgi:hypothetical protein
MFTTWIRCRLCVVLSLLYVCMRYIFCIDKKIGGQFWTFWLQPGSKSVMESQKFQNIYFQSNWKSTYLYYDLLHQFKGSMNGLTFVRYTWKLHRLREGFWKLTKFKSSLKGNSYLKTEPWISPCFETTTEVKCIIHHMPNEHLWPSPYANQQFMATVWYQFVALCKWGILHKIASTTISSDTSSEKLLD